jgi:hypothetical protein
LVLFFKKEQALLFGLPAGPGSGLKNDAELS